MNFTEEEVLILQDFENGTLAPSLTDQKALQPFVAAAKTYGKNEQSDGTPGERLLKYAGMLSVDDAETMMQTIQRDCIKTNNDL